MNETIIIGKDTKYPLDGVLSLPQDSSGKIPAVKEYKKEYKIPGKVDPGVLKDISEWIIRN